MTLRWGISPRASIESACQRRGRGDVVVGCISLLQGAGVDRALLLALAGPAANPFPPGTPRSTDYWLRVWGAPGLLRVWDPVCVPTIAVALEDPAWRFREMALRVVTRHRLAELFDEVLPLRVDPVPRVRTIATRAAEALVAQRR